MWMVFNEKSVEGITCEERKSVKKWNQLKVVNLIYIMPKLVRYLRRLWRCFCSLWFSPNCRRKLESLAKGRIPGASWVNLSEPLVFLLCGRDKSSILLGFSH